MKIFSRASVWLAVAALGSYLLQLLPFPGIFLMLLGGPFLTGLLIDLFFVALFVEALTRRLPRIFAIIPVAALVAYYGFYLQQTLALNARNTALHAANAIPAVPFDPDRHALVDEDSLEIVRRYAVPRAYQRYANYPEGYLVSLLTPADDCRAMANDSEVRVRKSYGAGRGMGKHFRDICDLSFPDRPQLPLMEVVRSGDIEGRLVRHGRDSGEQITEIRADGAIRARFTTYFTTRLAIFPLFLAGCVLIDEPSSWSCVAGFHRTVTALDGYSAGASAADRTAPERILLKLREYDDAELDDFHGYPQNKPFVDKASGEAGRVADRAFAALQAALASGGAALPSGMAYAVTQMPDRLAPLAASIAARFESLINEKDVPRDETQRVLDNALTAVPDADFGPLAPALFAALHETRRHQFQFPFPFLYIRSGGYAPVAELKADYLNWNKKSYLKTVPVLAICRAGKADAETIAAFKTDFGNATDDLYRQALAVALLKLGQRDFLRQNIGVMRRNTRDWLTMLLDGKGWNATGPNNCMTVRDLGSMDALSAVMQPLLVQEGRDGWRVR